VNIDDALETIHQRFPGCDWTTEAGDDDGWSIEADLVISTRVRRVVFAYGPLSWPSRPFRIFADVDRAWVPPGGATLEAALADLAERASAAGADLIALSDMARPQQPTPEQAA
jgi:hypothetical protein